jgi:MoaA/NifB/PqqE/SkfB family radical SAM enzyme
MKKLFLFANGVCDIACDYCYYSTKYDTRDRARIKPNQAFGVAQKIKDCGFGLVVLTGGDPLQSRLKHETYFLIEELKKQGLPVVVNTSGAGLDETDVQRIIDLDIDRVDFSIDSHLSEIHNAERGMFQESVNAMRGLLDSGFSRVATVTVVGKHNFDSLQDTLIWFSTVGVKDSHVHLAFEPGFDLSEKIKQLNGMQKVLPYLGYEHAFQHLEHTLRVFSGDSPHPMAQCQMGKVYFICNPEGVLTPCFHRKDLILGNLFTDSVKSILTVMNQNELTSTVVPSCYGPHCASLFDNPMFWKKIQRNG